MARLRRLPRLRRLLVHHPMAVRAIAQDEFEPFLEEAWKQQEEQMALISQGIMNDSTRALLLSWVGADVSKKDKWAFCFFWGDEFSLALLLELAHRGFRVIVAAVDKEEATSTMPAVASRWVRELLEGCGAAHFFPCVLDDAGGLRDFVAGLTPRLDCAVLTPPATMDLTAAGDMLRCFALGTRVAAWHQFADWILTRPMAALAALLPALERTPGARVGFWGSPLGSLTENFVGGFVPMRAAFAGLHAAVRSLALALPAAVVTGIFPG